MNESNTDGKQLKQVLSVRFAVAMVIAILVGMAISPLIVSSGSASGWLLIMSAAVVVVAVLNLVTRAWLHYRSR